MLISNSSEDPNLFCLKKHKDAILFIDYLQNPAQRLSQKRLLICTEAGMVNEGFLAEGGTA